MGLLDAIEELDKLANEPEPKVEEELEELETEDAEDEEQEDAPKEPDAKPEEKVAEKVEEKQPTPTDWYKLREESRRADAAERELQELRKKLEAPAKEEINPDLDPVGFVAQEIAEIKQWKNEQQAERDKQNLLSGAVNEFLQYENEFKAKTPDYEEKSKFVSEMLSESIRIQNPNASDAQVKQQTAHLLLQRASIAAQQGLNPAQALYADAERMGYEKEATPPQETKPRQTLTKLAENKKKSSGMSNGGGNGKAFIGNQEFLSMTNAERMKLTESDWARLEQEA